GQPADTPPGGRTRGGPRTRRRGEDLRHVGSQLPAAVIDRPRLRAVEAFPVEQKGQRFVALRDPAGYVEAVIMLPVDLVEILALFDGEHSIAAIQAELQQPHGENVPRENIEQ